MILSSPHALHGIKTALAAVLAYAITLLFNLEFGYWAVISTVIVMQVYVADSIDMCLYRLSGTAAGALAGVGVLLITPDHPAAVAAALFITIGICTFLTRYRTRYRMAAITVAIILMTGMAAPNTCLFGLSRVVEIFIGILCAFGVSVMVVPQRSLDVLTQRLEFQAEQWSRQCIFLVNAFVEKQQNVLPGMADDLAREAWDNHALLQKIRRNEAMLYQKDCRWNFAGRVALMSRLVEHLRTMVRALNAMDEQGHQIILSAEIRGLARESAALLPMIMRSSPPPDTRKLENRMTALDTRLAAIREDGLTRRFDSRRLVQVFSFYSSLVYLAEDILEAARTI